MCSQLRDDEQFPQEEQWTEFDNCVQMCHMQDWEHDGSQYINKTLWWTTDGDVLPLPNEEEFLPSPLSPKSAAEVTQEKHRSAFAASKGLPAPTSPKLRAVPSYVRTCPSSPTTPHSNATTGKKDAEFGQLRTGRLSERPASASHRTSNVLPEGPDSAKKWLESAIVQPAASIRLEVDAQLGRAQTKVQQTEQLIVELKNLVGSMSQTLSKEPVKRPTADVRLGQPQRNSCTQTDLALQQDTGKQKQQRTLPGYVTMTASFSQRRKSLEDEMPCSAPHIVRMSKANSFMLRKGLQFEVVPHGGTGSAPQPPQAAVGTALGTASLKAYLKERGWMPEDDGDSLSSDESTELQLDSVAKQRLAQARKLQQQRQQSADLQQRIERREQRREIAQRRRREEPKREALAMRQAMWLSVVALLARSFWEVPAKQRTVKLLTEFFIPLWRRYITIKKRRVARMFLCAIARKQRPLPMEEQLRGTGPLFKDWPSEHLQSFISKLYPVVFRYGEYICHQGDPSHVLYILVGGAVEVVIRLPNSKTKRRGKKTGLTVATLTPIRYFGEYGVFADEPRAASLLCVSRVDCWACSKEVFIFHLKRLPGPVLRDINTSFEANLIKVYKVRPAFLATTTLFLNWDIGVLEELVDELDPVVFYEGQVILRQGDPGVCIYLIARGQVKCSHAQPGHPDGVCHLGTNAHLGVRACLFVEAQWYTVQALTTVQAWCLKKSVLIGYMLQRPDEFIAAKKRLNQEFAKVIPKPTVEQLGHCSAFIDARVPFAVAEALHSRHLLPRVVECTAHLVSQGEPIRDLYFINHGACSINKQKFSIHSLLGLDLIQMGEKKWRHSLIAVDRLEVWSMSVAAVAQTLEALGKSPGKELARSLQLQLQLQAFLKATEGGGDNATRVRAHRLR
eukprot:GGOE01001992.1.p1 GENE.GGOE01001992.1~~GGOE01001992.1.p1  ORF type:complete len:904 (-),score=194.88 GGOE01001992.1:361-3072(-)